MSEKKEVAKKAQEGKKSLPVRILNWFKNLPGRIIGAFKNMASELKKVTWPTRQELINYSALVIAFIVAMALVVGLLTGGASALVQLLINA